MALLVHVVIAMASIIMSTISLITPNRRKLKVTYSLVVLTLVSGTYLVLSTHSSLLPSCEAGLVYIGIVSVALFAAQHRLAQKNASIER